MRPETGVEPYLKCANRTPHDSSVITVRSMLRVHGVILHSIKLLAIPRIVSTVVDFE